METSGESGNQILLKIQNQYLAGVPLRWFDWQVEDFDILNDPSLQSRLLGMTIDYPLSRIYPPHFGYQKFFLKTFMQKLESNNTEIADDIYTIYARLVAFPDSDDSNHGYKIYKLGSDLKIIMKENKSFVTQGSTGLITWQAGKVLAEWCINNKDVLYGRHIVELGCGIGFTGIVVLKCCKPQSYTFSDFHEEVLRQLRYNISINFEESKMSPITRIDNDHQISIVSIDWFDDHPQTNEIRRRCSAADVILAADVIYDVDRVPVFVRLLKRLLTPGTSRETKREENNQEDIDDGHKYPIALVACTIRNRDTVNAFLQETEKEGLSTQEVHLQGKLTLLFYDPSSPVMIIKITTGISMVNLLSQNKCNSI